MFASRFWPKRGFRPSFLRVYRSIVVRARVAPRPVAARGAWSSSPSGGRGRPCSGRRRPAGRPIEAVGAAVRDALRFPLAGPAARALVPARRRGSRSSSSRRRSRSRRPRRTRGSRRRRRRPSELERLGVPDRAPDAARRRRAWPARPARRDLERLGSSPGLRARFHGSVAVHDAEDPDLVEVGSHGGVPLRVIRALVETDAVVTRERRRDRAPRRPGDAARRRGRRDAPRGRDAESLLETGTWRPGWDLALALERRCSSRVPADRRVARARPAAPRRRARAATPTTRRRSSGSPARASPGVRGSCPRGRARPRSSARSRCELTAAAAFAGPPSVAHAEALAAQRRDALGGARRAARRDLHRRPADDAVPAARAAEPAAGRDYLGLGLALRLWRDRFPVARRRDGDPASTRFSRRFAHPTQQPYRTVLPGAAHRPRDARATRRAERDAAADPRAIRRLPRGTDLPPAAAVRRLGRVPRPRSSRLGAVVVAGCRDAVAARQLGFVPTHGLGGGAGDGPRPRRRRAARRLPALAAVLPVWT